MSPNTASYDVLEAEALKRIGDLELLSRRVVDGVLSGKHRSTFLGGSFEFANHRAYVPGDEIRMIDWKVYARRDRYYIRQFEETTNLHALMVVDCSGSMEFGLSTVSKFDYARAACACLSRLMLRQRDGVGLALVGKTVESFLPPRGFPRYLQTILHILHGSRCHGETGLPACLFDLTKRLKRKGIFFVFTDGLGDWSSTASALKRARLRGHEVLVFQVMAPEELSFQFHRWSRFECLEQLGQTLDLDPPTIRDNYLRNLNIFLQQVQTDCRSAGIEHVLLSTENNLGDVLSYYLHRRDAQNKKSRNSR